MIKADQSLWQLSIVKMTVLGLSLLAIIITLLIVLNSNLYWDFSYQGFNFAAEIFSIPIKIVASIIPIVGFIALYHRSEQTQKQIELATNQNIFANYFKHLEMFREHSEVSNTSVLTHANILYDRMYPEAHMGNFRLSDSFNDVLHSIVEGELKFIAQCYGETITTQKDVMAVASARLNALYDSFGVEPKIWHRLAENEQSLIKNSGLENTTNPLFYVLFRPILRGLEFLVINLNNQGRFDREFIASMQVGVFMKYSDVWSVESMLKHRNNLRETFPEKDFDPSEQLHFYIQSCLAGNGVTSFLLS